MATLPNELVQELRLSLQCEHPHQGLVQIAAPGVALQCCTFCGSHRVLSGGASAWQTCQHMQRIQALLVSSALDRMVAG